LAFFLQIFMVWPSSNMTHNSNTSNGTNIDLPPSVPVFRWCRGYFKSRGSISQVPDAAALQGAEAMPSSPGFDFDLGAGSPTPAEPFVVKEFDVPETSVVAETASVPDFGGFAGESAAPVNLAFAELAPAEPAAAEPIPAEPAIGEVDETTPAVPAPAAAETLLDDFQWGGLDSPTGAQPPLASGVTEDAGVVAGEAAAPLEPALVEAVPASPPPAATVVAAQLDAATVLDDFQWGTSSPIVAQASVGLEPSAPETLVEPEAAAVPDAGVVLGATVLDDLDSTAQAKPPEAIAQGLDVATVLDDFQWGGHDSQVGAPRLTIGKENDAMEALVPQEAAKESVAAELATLATMASRAAMQPGGRDIITTPDVAKVGWTLKSEPPGTFIVVAVAAGGWVQLQGVEVGGDDADAVDINAYIL
jgi:hypothetical protein